jgi:hypothetical protein
MNEPHARAYRKLPTDTVDGSLPDPTGTLISGGRREIQRSFTIGCRNPPAAPARPVRLIPPATRERARPAVGANLLPSKHMRSLIRARDPHRLTPGTRPADSGHVRSPKNARFSSAPRRGQHPPPNPAPPTLPPPNPAPPDPRPREPPATRHRSPPPAPRGELKSGPGMADARPAIVRLMQTCRGRCTSWPARPTSSGAGAGPVERLHPREIARRVR